jgi:WD40 repeat protein
MPDGKQIVIGGRDGLRLVDVADGQLVRSFEGNEKYIQSLAVSPDGKLALTASGAGTFWNLQLWEVASGKSIHLLQTGAFGSVTFSPNGKLMMAVGRLFHPPTDLEPTTEPVIWVWNVAKRELLATLNGEAIWGKPVAFSPDGKLAVAGQRLWPAPMCCLALWEATTGKPVHTLPEDGVCAVSFTPDGKGLLVGNLPKQRLALWSVATGKEVWTAHVDGAWPVAAHLPVFSSDGKLALTAGANLMDEPNIGKDLVIWDAVRGKRLRTLGGTDK